MSTSNPLDTSRIKDWRSIVTLVVFCFANIIVLFPFHFPIYVPRQFHKGLLSLLVHFRVIPPRRMHESEGEKPGKRKAFVKYRFPLNFITAPLIADLFLLAILAIGRQEVHDGTIGADNIAPLDVMGFFLSLAYIAISIDASGLIRYMAFKVLLKGGKVGHRLFFYLYTFFFLVGSFIGNDPIILSGTAFLAYMTRVSSNIIHPRAWIFTQFAVANIASAILVTSNPTNLVLAGAFNVKFIVYTANMIVPVIVTAIVLFPFLLYIIFANPALIPISIEMHQLTEEAKAKKPVNPNIPNARGAAAEEEKQQVDNDERNLLSLEEIMNPFLDKWGAGFGAVIMTATLVTIVALNAASQDSGEHPVFWVTVPAAVVMLSFDVAAGWFNRHQTREIARKGRQEVENARIQREEEERRRMEDEQQALEQSNSDNLVLMTSPDIQIHASSDLSGESLADQGVEEQEQLDRNSSTAPEPLDSKAAPTSQEIDDEKNLSAAQDSALPAEPQQVTLASLFAEGYQWCKETFPTVSAVIVHLPFPLIPFALSMFVLVQGLVSRGWVSVFAYGWDHWVNKTGTVGGIGGMAFLSVILCNFAGTNIGTTILLSRVIQAWQLIHNLNGIPISDRTFWGTVYGMAIGVNYGAFSIAFSASLAGLLWRDILARKHIPVRSLDFARDNLPIIALAMAVGCAVLVGEVYIIRGEGPYSGGGQPSSS